MMNRILALLASWRSRIRARRALASIDIRSLRDAGIDPGLADYEASQPFWRRPVRLRDSISSLTAQGIANDHAPVRHSQQRLAARQ